MHRFIISSVVVLASIHSSQVIANAGGGVFQQYEVATPDMGASYAGAGARASDAGAAYLNPAAMTLLDENRFHTLAGIYLQKYNLEFNVNNNAVGQPAGARGNGGQAGSIIPGFGIYLSKHIHDCIAVGFAFNDLYTTKIKYDEDWIGRNYLTKLGFRAYHFEPSIAYQLSPDFSLGFGLNILYGHLSAYELKNNILNAATINFSGSDWDWGFSLSGLYQYTQYTFIGIHYKSSVKFELGEQKNLPAGTIAYLDSRTKFAQGLNVSIRHEYTPNLILLADAGWSDWSEADFQNVIINAVVPSHLERQWQDTWRIAGGVEYDWDQCLKLRAGLSYDTNPSKRSTTYPDAPLTGALRASFGFSLKLAQGYTVSASYSYLRYRDVDLRNVVLPLGAVLSGYFKPASRHYLGLTVGI